METKNADLSSLKIDRDRKNVNPEQKGKLIKMIAGGISLVIILIVIVLLFRSYTSPAVEVKMTFAALQSSAQSSAILAASGYVVAQRKAAVASKGMGRIRRGQVRFRDPSSRRGHRQSKL